MYFHAYLSNYFRLLNFIHIFNNLKPYFILFIQFKPTKIKFYNAYIINMSAFEIYPIFTKLFLVVIHM